jgi:hypothetical protein
MIDYTIEMHRSPNLTGDEINQRLHNAFSRLTGLPNRNELATSSDNPGRETPLAANATAPEGAVQEQVYQEDERTESR